MMRRNRPARGRRGGRSLAMATLFGAASAVVLLELGLRLPTWFDPERAAAFSRAAAPQQLDWTAHPFLPYIGEPGHAFTIHWGDHDGPEPFKVGVQLNAHGFRAHEFPTRKAADDIVVICLGGSTTWGAIAPSNADTWPERLEAHLAAAYPNKHVRVYNLGLSGATTAMNLTILSTLAVHLQPDLVIAYEGFNDAGAADSTNFRTDHAHYYVDFHPDSTWLGFRHGMPDVLRHSHVVVHAANALDSVYQANNLLRAVTRQPDPQDRVDDETAAERIVANLRSMHAVAEQHGARALFATLQLLTGADALNPHLRRAFAAFGMDYVDLDAALPDNDRSLHIDECHFTHAGRARVAELFFEHIMAHRLLEPEE